MLALLVLHHDWWFWNDGRLLFGFLPVGLAYHALISLAAGGLWTWAAFFVMSDRLAEETSDENDADLNHSTQEAESEQPANRRNLVA